MMDITLKSAIVITFNRLLQTVKIHQDQNQLVIDSIDNFIKTLNQSFENESQISIIYHHGSLFVSEEKMMVQKQHEAVYQNLYKFFKSIGIKGVLLTNQIKSVSSKEIVSIFRLLNQADNKSEPLKWIVTQLEEQSITWLEIFPFSGDEDEDEDLGGDSKEFSENIKELARKSYSYAFSALKEVAMKISSNKQAGTRKAIRAVQKMVDLIIEDEPVLMGLSTIRKYDDYTYTHSINVSILCMCMGKRLRMSKISLERLGICGLFHDLGKVEVPLEILNKPGKLSTGEYDVIKKHSLNSVRQILRLSSTRDLKANILLPPFEHHLKYDLTGYPKTKRKKPISLFGRILTISDVFDALTSPRIYRPYALSPDRALKKMVEKSGRDFDPILLKVFINMLGVYPVGTLLHLDDGSLGIVVNSTEDFDRTRPNVMLLALDNNGQYQRKTLIDLTARDRQTGKYLRNIVNTSHAGIHNIQPASLIL